MKNKTIVITIAVLVIFVAIGGAFYFLNANKVSKQEIELEKETQEEQRLVGGDRDEIFNLLTELKDTTLIKFSQITNVEFDWYLGEEMQKTIVKGKGFDVLKVSLQPQVFKKFFEGKNFEPDFYNMADGTVVGAEGYKKGQIVCSVVQGVSGYKEATDQWIPPETDKMDVEIKCGGL